MISFIWLAILLSFFLSLGAMPFWIKKCREVGLVWEDMNKFKHPKNVAASGGIVVVMAFLLGVLAYIAIKTFIYSDEKFSLEIFALLTTILILGLVGLTDDLLGWKKGGLKKRVRIGMALFASIPLVVINVGDSTMNLPFFGSVNFGIFYSLLIVPLAVTYVTTTYNFLAGFNGLEAGMGVLVLSFLSYVSYATGNPALAVVGLCMVVSLLGFYYYNKFPAKVFPGDILTYSVGALVVGMAILGNFEKIALVVFIPYIIEMILKSTGKLKKQSFGIPDKNNNLKMPYEKIYGLTHFSLWFLHKFKKNVSEKDVVYFIFIIQIIFILLAFLML
jgi:UDP-N-acetylglucosamine--dolichyl-phosphate N-acetylglucosaminephosphotransferase